MAPYGNLAKTFQFHICVRVLARVNVYVLARVRVLVRVLVHVLVRNHVRVNLNTVL
jgi:hypothetical protein